MPRLGHFRVEIWVPLEPELTLSLAIVCQSQHHIRPTAWVPAWPWGQGFAVWSLTLSRAVCQMPSSQTAKQQPLFWWENRDGYAGSHGSGRTGHTFLDSPAQGLQQPTVLQPLVSCPKLVLLHLQGNPLCQAVGASEHLAELLPSINSILT